VPKGTVAGLPCCAFCDGTSLDLVIDLGEVALAGAFLREAEFEAEDHYPLRVFFCTDCYAVQVVDRVSADVLFDDYFYFSSSIQTLRDHFQAYAREVVSRFLEPGNATVLEFGCNDGVLLKPLADLGVARVIGVDPAKNVIASIADPRLTLINDFFNERVAADVLLEYGPVDLVLANNVYAHVPDIQGITRAVRTVLADEGVFVFEVHYLGRVIDEMQYDMIYHEHLYYYSLLSAMSHFAMHDMVVFDVEPVPIHAGSLRFYVAKKESSHASSVSERVRDLERQERARGFDRSQTFQRFSGSVQGQRDALLTLLRRLRSEGASIAGYGASGRANTMIQYCGIDSSLIDYVIDDAPAKQGFFTPGSHLPIRSRDILQTSAPDYVLIFAWSFLDEIRARIPEFEKAGGRLIVPLPKVTVI
jgi:SAM-dependent methyltransferase